MVLRSEKQEQQVKCNKSSTTVTALEQLIRPPPTTPHLDPMQFAQLVSN